MACDGMIVLANAMHVSFEDPGICHITMCRISNLSNSTTAQRYTAKYFDRAAPKLGFQSF